MSAAIPASINKNRYSGTAVALHWTIAALIICAFTLAWIMTNLGISPLKLRMVNWHKWVGITILSLAIIRLLWRLTHRPPEMLPMPTWQRVSAKVIHASLYVLLLLQPLLGWAYSNAVGYPVVYLGIIPLPNLVAKNKQLADVLVECHEFFGWCLLVIVSLHVLAALKHHFIDADATLKRMWFK